MRTSIGIKAFLLLFFSFFAVHTLFAQHTLSGKVTDERNRQPLAFVNVVVNEGLQGVITDIDGKYEIVAYKPIRRNATSP